MYLMHSNLKNNMVSVQDDGSNSTFYQQIFYWRKHKQLDFQSGLSAWTYPRRLTGYTGPHCGLPSLSKEFLNFAQGTPDREAETRSKIQSTDLVPKALPELTESVSKVN